eukprot:272910-Chlamydomonas_euryale.AAC.1
MVVTSLNFFCVVAGTRHMRAGMTWQSTRAHATRASLPTRPRTSCLGEDGAARMADDEGR